jgi:hypothetical protein
MAARPSNSLQRTVRCTLERTRLLNYTSPTYRSPRFVAPRARDEYTDDLVCSNGADTPREVHDCFARDTRPMIGLQFAATALVIVLAGVRLARYGDVLGEKTGLGRSWIGVVLSERRKVMCRAPSGV